jgi:nitrogen fixation protein NifB
VQIEHTNRPNVAVASFSGIEVDLHIGHARQLLIYGPGEDGIVSMLGPRATPEPGGGEARWKALAEVLNDCFALLASGAGLKPIKILEDQGIDVFITKGNIKRPVEILFDSKEKEKRLNLNAPA